MFGADDSLVFAVALEFCVLINREESLVGQRETISSSRWHRITASAPPKSHDGTEQWRARHRNPTVAQNSVERATETEFQSNYSTSISNNAFSPDSFINGSNTATTFSGAFTNP